MRALTAAALALPGLTQPPAHAAEGDEASFEYSRYEEGERELFGARRNIKPIQVDSLLGRGRITLFDRLKFAFNYMQDTWSGATPIATAPLAFGGNIDMDPTNPVSGASQYIEGSVLVDEGFNAYKRDPLTGNLSKETRTVHTIASASPEVRKQGDFRLGYEWNEAALELGGGISLEDDYESRWGNANVRLDLNQKRTTLNLGLSYTDSDIAAILNNDAFTYFDSSAYEDRIDIVTSPDGSSTSRTLRDDRHDWSVHFGLSQVLNKDALIETGFGFTRSTGFLENPYKVVEFLFVDPAQEPIDFGIPGVSPLLTADVRALLEQRPDTRNQWTWNARFVQYFTDWDAALHLDYRFFHDDWGINAHTFEAAWGQPLGCGWTITPRVRYYTQGQADFYQPFFISKQAALSFVFDPITGNVSFMPFNRKLLPADFSSDHRLSGYGALSGGLTVSKQFAKGVELEAGFEYYTHQGDLKLGGGGEGAFADFDNFLVNAGLRVDLSAPFLAVGSGHSGQADGSHGGHSGGRAPAGVMFDHMLPEAGDFMVGYRYMYSRQDGDTLRGTDAVSDAAILANACGDRDCTFTSVDMDMHMHMLDIVYAPTDWLNLMLMPQFVDMAMTLRTLEGAVPEITEGGHQHGGGNAGHETGGVGDTSFFALFKLLDVPGHHLHLGVGVSAPTGAVDEKTENGTFLHYHMQLGSGTWDFRPSLTYTGHLESWSWGGQVSGTKRLEDENESGYALGDVFQATAWGSYELTDWLSGSVRGVYTTQGEIEGEFNGPHEDSIPLDFPANYGGKYWDVGFGLSAAIPIGDFKDNRLSVEWLEPIVDDVNGFQLEREGTLSVSWSVKF